MSDPRVDVLERAPVYQGYFTILRYRLRFRRFSGEMGEPIEREVFERGHAVAVLPYDPVADRVVLIEQFRIGALETEGDPWLLEPVAGIIEAGETPEEVARRESLEEAGLEPEDLIRACDYFVSPGGATEQCLVYIGRVDSGTAGGEFGLAHEGEDIRVHVMGLDDALARISDGRIRVASTIIALQWLALNRGAVRARWAGGAA
jgi:ADP-ribose pyrophosphatase